MDKGISSAEYLKEIANHRRRVKYILYVVNILQLLVALLPVPILETHRTETVAVLIIGFIYQMVYWQYFTRKVVTNSRQILLFSIPYTFSFTAAAYFSQNLLMPGMIIMLVTTTMVFSAKELTILTLEDLAIVTLLFGYDCVRGLVTPEMRMSFLYLVIIILSTGLTAAVATFEIKEKERRMVRLEELDRIKTTFIAIVSHNLRTPIAVISGFIEVLEMQKGSFDRKANGIIEGIKQNARALNELVENTVNISQYQSGERHLAIEPMDLGALLRELAQTKFEPEAASKNLEFKLVVPEQPCMVDADKRQISVALGEVIGNAIKFTPLGSVNVSARVLDSQVLITVGDTGPGIPADFQEQMFTQFNRPGNILIYEQKGVGLGLYLTKLIVEAHRGSIWFESHEGKGTTFFVALPSQQHQVSK